MTVTTLATLLAAKRELVTYNYTASRTAVAAQWFSIFGQAFNGTTGVLAGTSTTTGVVPTDATAGFMPIESFNGNPGFISDIDFQNTVQCRFRLVDMLWKAGAYAFNASTTGQTPTSFASRVPGGTDFVGTEIWLEQVTAGTGIQNVNVTYTNQSGTTGRSTGTVATAANIVGRMWRLPLQSGDTGVQGVTGVVGSTATVGTFNILVVRPLFSGSVDLSANSGAIFGMDKTLMPAIFDTSALTLLISPVGTATGLPYADIGVVSG